MSQPFHRSPPRAQAEPLPRARGGKIGWQGLLISLGIHSLAVAAICHFSFSGFTGSDAAAAASEPRPDEEFRLLPPPPKPASQQTAQTTAATKPMRSFQPAGMRRITASNWLAAVSLPEFDIPPAESVRPAEIADAPPEKNKPPVADDPPGKPARSSSAAAKPKAKIANGTGSGGQLQAATPPRLISSPPPPYPQRARTAKAEGAVTVRVTVSAEGKVLGCSLHRSTGNTDLDQAALKAVRRWRFTPGMSAAKPVQSDVLVRVVFRVA